MCSITGDGGQTGADSQSLDCRLIGNRARDQQGVSKPLLCAAAEASIS